ncbi:MULTISPECIES: phosphotransferase [unclassified Pseudoclavibacter]|uniref:phosphotransferase n=1 Tax=unclassified Pseudoclavibacter TaxID=2615177 RepID=UPI000CE7ADE5|nr:MULTISPECIES: phosphotransferase [unclassified Pseudoclavibacter]PPF36988.1 hypothetical protein C5E05_08490 [Pseudoclavibacter sp. AY1H1]PPG01924.1 hypothetical protein C5E06_14685 [Pseudoclavibacter sp. RFBI5]
MNITTDADSASAHASAAAVDEVNVADAEIIEILRTRFEIHASAVQAVGAESAAVFRAVDDRDTAFAVKVFWADASSSAPLRWHQEVVQRVAEAGLPVAQPRRSTAGELTVEAETGKRALLVQVSDWLSGTPLERVPMRKELLREIGHVAARLHQCLRLESAPAGHGEHPWQITESRTTIERALKRIAILTDQGQLPGTAKEVARLERAADTVFTLLAESVAPRLSRLPTTVVHHDLHDSNLLVGPGTDHTTITGILDFGDMARSIRISEPVIAGAYAARHCADPMSAVDEVMTGWSASVPVTSDEAAVVLPLAAARLLANATVWMSRLGTARGDYAAHRRRGSLETAEALLHAV